MSLNDDTLEAYLSQDSIVPVEPPSHSLFPLMSDLVSRCEVWDLQISGHPHRLYSLKDSNIWWVFDTRNRTPQQAETLPHDVLAFVDTFGFHGERAMASNVVRGFSPVRLDAVLGAPIDDSLTETLREHMREHTQEEEGPWPAQVRPENLVTFAHFGSGARLVASLEDGQLYCVSVAAEEELLGAYIRPRPLMFGVCGLESTFTGVAERSAECQLEAAGITTPLPPAPLEVRELSVVTNRFDQQFALIPGGTFQMGSPPTELHRSSDEQVTTQTVDDFWIGTHEVTVKQMLHWRKSAGKAWNNSVFPLYQWDMEQGLLGDFPSPLSGDAPVIGITGQGAKAYCEWLTSVLPGVYRLPTETEWEYACRGRTATTYYWGDGKAPPDAYAWYSWNCDMPQPVGLKLPNQFGLFDMCGNADEWCTSVDPGDGLMATRGGCYFSYYRSLRPASTDCSEDDSPHAGACVRLVWEPPTD
ncbi:MAG: formylglycine-generating enzyme family protein [Planctomycetaceae bacterium]|nr:formylglycine-generating enzyme family protein [Planctomycetaceae bacterium]